VVLPPFVDHAALSTEAVFVFVLCLFLCFAHLLTKHMNINMYEYVSLSVYVGRY